MYDSLIRQWLLLRMVPREPKSIDNAALRGQLSAALGPTISSRMVHRDLVALAGVFPLTCNSKSKPHGWSWMRSAPGLEFPNMDPATALVFSLVEQHLRLLLPPSLLGLLSPSFDQARRTLEALGGGLSTKIRIVASGPPLRPPSADAGVVEALTEALFRGRRIRLNYRKAGAEAGTLRDVDPLGLVLRGSSLVLVARGKSGPVHFLAHRCSQAVMLDEAAETEPGFDLDAHAASGAFGIVLQPAPMTFVGDFESGAAQALVEAPLSGDQTAVLRDGGRTRVTATVVDSRVLRSWLMGFGERLEIIAPESLRADFAVVARRMAEVYGRDPA